MFFQKKKGVSQKKNDSLNSGNTPPARNKLFMRNSGIFFIILYILLF